MRTIAHISDLHFGKADPAVAAALLDDLRELKPSLVVVSGDLTQRARRGQFQDAQEFLRKIPFPILVIPGNHDVPLYDVFRRFLSPLGRYRKFITDDLTPLFRDEEMAVLGINTARSFTWKSGRISMDQIARIRERLCPVRDTRFKIIVTHHPFIPPPEEPEAGIDLVGRAVKAMRVIDECAVDLLLSGHLHHGYTGDVRTYYPATKRSIIVVQAGTAISHRVRNEPNGYNHLVLDENHMWIAVRVWKEGRFQEGQTVSYRLRDEEWRLEKEAPT